jgi:predicted nucleic acid-binding protein
MGAAGYLIDTNTIIDFSAKRLPAKAHQYVARVIDDYPQISVINKIELLGFNHVPEEIIAFTENAFVITLDDNIVAQTILLRKKYKIKLPDAIIAATALTFDLTIITNNTDDFKSISELQVLNPYSVS